MHMSEDGPQGPPPVDSTLAAMATTALPAVTKPNIFFAARETEALVGARPLDTTRPVPSDHVSKIPSQAITALGRMHGIQRHLPRRTPH